MNDSNDTSTIDRPKRSGSKKTFPKGENDAFARRARQAANARRHNVRDDDDDENEGYRF
jgi:hypothetical protein